MTCDHCRALRAHVEAASERLGRPVDSFDDLDVIPRRMLPTYDEVRTCPCACHSHLAIVGRWAPRSS